MSSLDLHASATALILASACGDTQAVTLLLLDRSAAELVAMLAYCARFASTLAMTVHEQPHVHPIELLEHFSLTLAARQTTS